MSRLVRSADGRYDPVFSKEEWHTIVHGLRTAAERFDECAKAFAKEEERGRHVGNANYELGMSRTKDQFEKQARESRALADEIEAGGFGR